MRQSNSGFWCRELDTNGINHDVVKLVEDQHLQNTMEYKLRVLMVASVLFGKDFKAFINEQARMFNDKKDSAYVSCVPTHLHFMQDCVNFLTNKPRLYSHDMIGSLLTVVDCRVDWKEKSSIRVDRKLWESLLVNVPPLPILEWINKPNGVIDLVQSLSVAFGRPMQIKTDNKV